MRLSTQSTNAIVCYFWFHWLPSSRDWKGKKENASTMEHTHSKALELAFYSENVNLVQNKMHMKFHRNPSTPKFIKREAASHQQWVKNRPGTNIYSWQHRSGFTEIICRLRFGLRLTGVSESKPDLSVWRCNQALWPHVPETEHPSLVTWVACLQSQN